jgi:tungstate transport system ATP-binding protein
MKNTHFCFHDIHKSFHHRSLLAIDKIELKPGQCTALIGSNGAGKTTLLKIMAGLEQPQHAWVSHDDVPARSWQQARLSLRRDVVYLHQFAYMFDTSVEKNVGYGLSCAHVPQRERRQRVSEALSRVGLVHLIDADAKKLSGGERQRTALARALVLEPKLLLLDEPTASMDKQSREQTVPLLRQLKESGLTTVIVSHDISSLGSLPDVCLQLAEGRLAMLSGSERNRGHVPTVSPFSPAPVLPLPMWGASHV